jgi:hypothetical protein
LREQKIVVLLPKTLTDRQRSYIYATVQRAGGKMELRRVLLVTENDAFTFTIMMRILRKFKPDLPVYFLGRFVGPTELDRTAKPLPQRKSIKKNMRARLEGLPGIEEEVF